jgi:hypothetical protein
MIPAITARILGMVNEVDAGLNMKASAPAGAPRDQEVIVQRL